jgi:hypothetical protein
MNIEEFKNLIKGIIGESVNLKDKHIGENNIPVNYVAIFCQNKEEYRDFANLASELGMVYKNTETGPLFLINLDTNSGKLKLLKIRKPDRTRKERGDADFTISDYDKFKKDFLKKKGFKIIKRENFEMIELIDSRFNVRAYFSNPPLEEQFGLNKF